MRSSWLPGVKQPAATSYSTHICDIGLRFFGIKIVQILTKSTGVKALSFRPLVSQVYGLTNRFMLA